MKTEKLSNIILLALPLTILISVSCNRSQKGESELANEMATIPQGSLDMNSSLALRLDRKPDIRKVDWEAFYQSGLKKYGIGDFSTESLIRLMDSEIPSVRYFSASLLGERKERSAIPRLEESLGDKSIGVKIAATRALLKMGNRKGIKVLEDFCQKASGEFERGNHRNTVDMSDALRVLAEAGEISAIPYLRQLLGYDRSWGVRLTAVRSLRKLYEKEPAVLADIASALRDQHPQVRRETFEILRGVYDSYAEDKQKSK
jgi:HEAT repeat protein